MPDAEPSSIEYRWSNSGPYIIDAAKYFADESRKYEKVYRSSGIGEAELLDERKYCGYTMAAIVFADSYIDNVCNIVIERVLMPAGVNKTRISPETAEAVRFEIGRGKDSEFRKSLFEKCQFLLKLLKRPEFPKDSNVLNQAQCLRQLRNFFAHSSPEWNAEIFGTYATGQSTNAISKLKAKLAARKIAINPYHKGSFPAEYLSRSCAEWACSTSESFTAEFVSRTGLILDLREELKFETLIFVDE
jgi:hypothetical protein